MNIPMVVPKKKQISKDHVVKIGKKTKNINTT